MVDNSVQMQLKTNDKSAWHRKFWKSFGRVVLKRRTEGQHEWWNWEEKIQKRAIKLSCQSQSYTTKKNKIKKKHEYCTTFRRLSFATAAREENERKKCTKYINRIRQNELWFQYKTIKEKKLCYFFRFPLFVLSKIFV